MAWKHFGILTLLALLAAVAAKESHHSNHQHHGHNNHLHNPVDAVIQNTSETDLTKLSLPQQKEIDEEFEPGVVSADLENEEESDDEAENKKNNAALTRNIFDLLDARKSNHVDCDMYNQPMYSCYDCYNYVECKDSGGKIKACKSWATPYCNGGACSATPTAECEALIEDTI